MDRKYIYSLNKIHCQYPRTEIPVLYIDNLNIERGKIYFLVGPSGVGKSTILETLGLMNNTGQKNIKGSHFRYHEENNTTIDLVDIWKEGEKRLAKFRSRHLSFIFQSTNLFSYLNAYENATITSVLHGLTLDKAKLKSRQVLARLFDPPFTKEIIQGKPTLEMSGGQKQRLAFARALGTNFEVILADEPTGNLDPNNAQKLLGILQDIIHNENKTAIIVSHDIELATSFGEAIILMERKQLNGQNLGYVSSSSQFIKENDQWKQSLDSGKVYSNSEIKKLLLNIIK